MSLFSAQGILNSASLPGAFLQPHRHRLQEAEGLRRSEVALAEVQVGRDLFPEIK